jgi:hypothetical protein
MGGFSIWFKALLEKLNLHKKEHLSQKESVYKQTGEIESEIYFIQELGAYVHAIIETLNNDTMGKVFLGLKRASSDFIARPHLREAYLLADDPLKVPCNKSRRSDPPRQMTQAEESFAISRMKKLLTMPMLRGRATEIKESLEDISLGVSKADRATMLATPSVRLMLEIGMARIWLFHICEAAAASNKLSDLVLAVEGVPCLTKVQMDSLLRSDYHPSTVAEILNSPGLRDRRRVVAGNLLKSGISLTEMPQAYPSSPVDSIDYPGESDHKIFPILTNPELRPSQKLPHYSIVTTDFDIIVYLLKNVSRLVFNHRCGQCKGCLGNEHWCQYKGKILKNVTVHMRTSYSPTKKGKNGELIEVEEPPRVFHVVELHRAIHMALRSANEFKWMLYPLDTILFLFILCASNSDYCDGLPGIGPEAVFRELAVISSSPKLAAKYKDMVVVDPLTYIGLPRSLVEPSIDFDKVRSFVISMYTRKYAKLLSERDIVPDAISRQYTLDQIFTAETAAHKRIGSINETRFMTVLGNATWNFKYLFNGFVDATAYRDNCLELDSTGKPKYSWIKTIKAASLGASHHINSGIITNDF